MAYTNVWDETAPLGSQAANLIDDDFRALKVDIGERLTSIFGIGTLNALDPVAPLFLNLKGSATSKIIPGATSLSFRNNADSGDNIVIADAGAVTIGRGVLTLSAAAANPPLVITKDASSGSNRYIRLTDTGAGGKQWDLVNQGDSGKNFLIYNNTDSIIVLTITPIGQVNVQNTLTVASGGLIVSAGGTNITGNSSIVGTLLINGGAGASLVEIRGAASNKRSLFYTSTGSVRWESYADSTAEGGSNAGSNYQLSRYDDTGTFLDNAISIFRSTGSILFTSLTGAQSRFRLTGVVNNTAPSFLDIYGSPSASPSAYAWLGGLYGDFNAGVPSKIGLFGNAVDLEFKSTNTANTINLLNKVSLSTTGVAAGTSILDINKDNGASSTLYIKINRAGSTKGFLGLDSGDNICFFDNTGGNKIIQFVNGGSVVIGNQVGTFPSASFVDGSNQMDMGWNTNTFYFKQSIGTMRNIQFRTSANADIFIIDLLNQKVTCSGVTDTATGYRIGNAAAAGKFLRGDGTNFVSSSILTSDFPVQDCARVYRTTTLDLVVTTLTPIGFDAEDFDSNNLHDNVTNNTRLTAPSAGKYLITAHISWSGAASNVFAVIRKNGVATDLAKTSKNVTSSSVEVTEINVILVLSATDYVEVYGQNDTAVNPDIIAGIERTYFQMTRISS